MTSVSADGDPVRKLNEKATLRGWAFVCERGPHFEAPKLVEVHALWESRSAPGKLPARAEFSARDLLRVLPVLMIAEIVRTDDRMRFRYRYVGTQMASTIGEMTGRFLDEVLPEPSLERTTACYQATVDAREPLRVVTRSSLNTVSYLSAEILSAPLAGDGTTVDMLMTVTSFRTTP
jgi:hypothetical protein